MFRWLIILVLALSLPALAAAADRPPAGLLWNRSGLPATIPLQVRTPPGRDFALMLIDPQTDVAMMGGYIRGGAPFRLLVPPGKWVLRFGHGDVWQGDEEAFGPSTVWFETDAPLDFRITGAARRGGHLVTLAGEGAQFTIKAIAAQDWCQITIWSSEMREYPPDRDLGRDDPDRLRGLYGTGPESSLERRPQLRYLDRTTETHERVCDQD